VLLKPKRKDIIKYENKELVLNELEAVVMDFENSKLNQFNKQIDLIKNIIKFINSIFDENKFSIDVRFDKNALDELKSSFINIHHYYNQFENIIDGMGLY
jgi:hypothetical protein